MNSRLSILLKVFLAVTLTAVVIIINDQDSFAAAQDWQQSASIVPTSPEDFASENFKRSLENLAATGANMVTLIIPYYQDNTSSSSIYRGHNTPTDAALQEAIRYAHSIGLEVNLKTHIETYSGDWRAYISPDNRDQWYGEYEQMLNHYGQIGQSNGVTQMTVGAEMWKTASEDQNQNNTQRWESMIGNLKNTFSGSLTYSANHGGPREVETVQFWDNLDYIGIAAYFPLATDKENPTVEELRASWSHWDNTVIKPLHDKWGKPIVFTEIGYRSIDGAHKEPFSFWREGAEDEEEQARDYEALFSYWNNQPYFKGVHLWDWVSSPNPDAEKDYTPQNKQAETVMANWFGGNGSSPEPTEPFEPANYKVTATANPSSANVGEQVVATVKVMPDAAQEGTVIDVEIFDSSGQLVRQEYFENQAFGTNEEKTYMVSWSPSSASTYRVDVGIFSPNWQELITWAYQTATVQVQEDGISPSPSPTPTPTQGTTPTPTPTPTGTVSPAPTPTPTPDDGGEEPIETNIAVWWPENGARINGTQPFKAMVNNMDVSSYRIVWTVDGGAENAMAVSQQDYPHYESLVNLSSWAWSGVGPYTVRFVAYDNSGGMIGEQVVEIFVE